MNKGQLYEVEKILDKKKFNNIDKYRIKWKGFSEQRSTWEPIDNLSNVLDLVEQFEENLKKSKSGKKCARKTAKTNKSVDKSDDSNNQDESDDDTSKEKKLSARKRKASEKSSEDEEEPVEINKKEKEVAKSKKKSAKKKIKEEEQKDVEQDDSDDDNKQSENNSEEMEEQVDEVEEKGVNKNKNNIKQPKETSKRMTRSCNFNQTTSPPKNNLCKSVNVKETKRISERTKKSAEKNPSKNESVSEFQDLPKKGDFKYDNPLRIINAKQHETEDDLILCEVQWQKRPDGILPQNSFYTNQELKKIALPLLCTFYEEKLVFPIKKNKN